MFSDFISRPNSNSTPLSVEFSEPVILENIPAKVITANSIKIDYFIDSPSRKTVVAYPTRDTQNPRHIVLWSGDEYDAIGQWTDTDAINKIRQIFETT